MPRWKRWLDRLRRDAGERAADGMSPPRRDAAPPGPRAPGAPGAARAPSAALPAEPAGGRGQTVALLAVTRDAAQSAALRLVADANGWTLALAPSADDAARCLGSGPSVVVIVDRDLPGDDWRRTLPRLAALPRTACVLLASTVADEYLWQEVNRHGGHDILPKPLRRDEVVRAVTFAWSWRGERRRGT
jgi:hypothetical protein